MPYFHPPKPSLSAGLCFFFELATPKDRALSVIFDDIFSIRETGMVFFFEISLIFDLIHDSWKVFHPKYATKTQIDLLSI